MANIRLSAEYATARPPERTCLFTDTPKRKKVTGSPETRSPFKIYANMLFENGCDARKGLAFESLEHSAAAGAYVAYLVGEAHL